MTSRFFHIHSPRQQDTMASQCDISLCVSGGGEKKKKAESRPPSAALELLLWIDEPAAADGRIFCLIYVSAARRRSDQTADSSLSNAAAG